MPRFDKTGPDGKGPRTGRGQGDCPPDSRAKPDSLPRRLGRGMRNRFFPSRRNSK